MKKFILTFLILFIIISSFCQDTDFTSTVIKRTYNPPAQGAPIAEADFTNDESFLENIVLPSDLGGAVPMDIIYMENYNKFYVYGKRRLLVIDALTNTVSNSLEISMGSQYYPAIRESYYDLSEHENHFALAETDNGDFVYCSTEELELIKINPIDDTWEVIVETPVDLPKENTYSNTMLKYDNRTNRLYWFIGQYPHNSVYIIDATTYGQVTKIDVQYGSHLRDIEINEVLDEFYINTKNELRVYNAISFDYTIAAEGEFFKGDLLYINHGSIHKLYSFPKHTGSQVTTQIHQIDFNNNNAISSFDSPQVFETACYFNASTEEIYVGYKKYNLNQSDIYIIDPVDNSIVGDLNTNIYSSNADNIPIFFKSFNNNILIGKTNETVIIDENTHGFSLLGEVAERNVFLNCAVSPTNALIISPWGGNIKIVDIANTIENTLEVGAILHYGCFNENKNKTYFYSKEQQGKDKVYIYNTITEEISIVEMGNNISDIFVYAPDENTNYVYVSFYDDTRMIKAIDGETDEITDSQYWIYLEKHYCEEMFFAPNNKLYCIVGMENDPDNSNKRAGIEIKDASDGFVSSTFHHYTSFPSNGLLVGEFTYNASNNNVYATAIDLLWNTFKKFTEIDGETNVCQDYNRPERQNKLVANPYHSKIYIQDVNETTVTVYSCKADLFSQIEIVGNVWDMEYDHLRNLVFVLYDNPNGETSKLGFIDNEVFYPGIDIPLATTSIAFNPGDFNIYAYIAHNLPNNNETEIWKCEINGTNGQDINITTTAIPLENFYVRKYPSSLVDNDIIFDENQNQIYVANGGHSNISKLSYEPLDYLVIRPGVGTWLSIPRHERTTTAQLTPTEDVFDQQNISYTYDYLKLDYNFINENDAAGYENIVNATYDEDVLPAFEWVSSDATMDDINSTRGYELSSENTNYELLMLTGEQQDPTTSIDLYCKKDNWMGYFLEEEQDVFNALASIVPDIYHIRHQDYNCWRHNFPVPNQCGGTTKSSSDFIPGTWVCDRGRPVIKYGDMIKVKPIEDIYGFQWNYSGPPSSERRTETEHYTYTEQTDYDTFVIELDTSEAIPTEIGAFVNDCCVGACSVTESDSVVVLSAYMETAAGDSVIFEKHYGSTKMSNNVVDNYYVKNNISGQFEKRAVFTGEKQDAFIVSFRKEKAIEPDKTPDFSINMYPNPAQNIVHFKLITKAGAMIEISILDISGRKVSSLLHEENKSGTLLAKAYLNDFNGNKLAPGIYFVSFVINDAVETRKLVVQ